MCKIMEDLRDQSFAEGKAEGREEGKDVKAREAAINMNADGMAISLIAKYVDVEESVVKQWLR